jgi:hypothetical protein
MIISILIVIFGWLILMARTFSPALLRQSGYAMAKGECIFIFRTT